jgi:hypothetical protein
MRSVTVVHSNCQSSPTLGSGPRLLPSNAISQTLTVENTRLGGTFVLFGAV